MLRNGKTWVHKKRALYLPFVIDSKKICILLENLKKLFDTSPDFINYGISYSDGVSEQTKRLDDITTFENPKNKRISELKIMLREEDETSLSYAEKNGIDIELQEEDEYGYANIYIEIAGPEDWVNVSLLQIQQFIKEIVPSLTHKTVAPKARKLFGAARSMAWVFMPIIFLVLGILFTKEAFLGGVHTTLNSWPNELTIPVHLTEKIQYDRDAKSIRCNGAMTEKEKRKLLSLSNEVSYQQSIMKLYNESNFASAAIFWLTVSACLIGALLLTLLLLVYLFPMGAFLIGEGETRYSELLTLRRNILWSVIVTTLLGVTVPLVYKLIFNG